MSRISHCQSAQRVRYRKEELELSFASGKGDFSLCYRVQTGSRGCGGGRGNPAFYPPSPGDPLTEGKSKEAWHSTLYSILARQLRRTGATLLKTGHGAPVGVQPIAKWYIQSSRRLDRRSRRVIFNIQYIPSSITMHSEQFTQTHRLPIRSIQWQRPRSLFWRQNFPK
jgi:hypothetical protein